MEYYSQIKYGCAIYSPVLHQVGEDAFLLFWDLRAGSMMGGYWEAHDDDVTCVK